MRYKVMRKLELTPTKQNIQSNNWRIIRPDIRSSEPEVFKKILDVIRQNSYGFEELSHRNKVKSKILAVLRNQGRVSIWPTPESTPGNPSFEIFVDGFERGSLELTLRWQ